MTEPGSGSDVFAMRTTAAQRDGDDYVLNGTKTFVTNAPGRRRVRGLRHDRPERRGSLGLTAFLVERDTPGLVGRASRSTRWACAPRRWASSCFEDCWVPGGRAARDAEGAGMAVFNSLDGVGARLHPRERLGTMERQLERCVEHARERKQFGKPIGKFQAVANRLVDMKVRLETAGCSLYRSAG